MLSAIEVKKQGNCMFVDIKKLREKVNFLV